MNLNELFQQNGLAVIATADAQGNVNTAVYARPHVIDETTLVWGMTERRTYRNILQNPHASFLFKTSTPGFNGVRLALRLIKTEEEGELLEQIRRNADAAVGPGTGEAIRHAAWFTVTEVRPLVS